MDSEEEIECPDCGGDGDRLWQQADSKGDQLETVCDRCDGRGTLDRPPPCLECEGAKILTADHDPTEKFDCPTCKGVGYELEDDWGWFY